MLGGMSFQDLPSNVRELSLEDPVLAADVVDLCCFEDARERGAIAVLTCDAKGRMVQPVLVDEIAWQCPDPDRARLVDLLLEPARMLGGSLVIAFGRSGTLVTDIDRRWHQSVLDGCLAAGVRLLGAYVAAPDRVVRLPDPGRLAVAI